MLKLSVQQIIAKINSEEIFEAVADDYSFTLKISNYVPYICAAIHDGHQFRKELWDNCTHSDYQRWFEEDPATLQMIQNQPIVIAGSDSRFEYDLNRAPQEAVFETAWGKQLWKQPLSEAMKAKSIQKHRNFYKVVNALVEKIESKFKVCVVYDLHSYNWKRWDREVPTFNLGTTNVDNNRFGESVEVWRKSLSEIELPYNLKSTSKINDTFFGNGYFLKAITSKFNNTLVLATEVKKIYCDELNYVIYPEIVSKIKEALDTKIKEHATYFYNTFTNKNI
ncbi:N-formylglutamate amidohydrolase [Lutibacter sp.]